MGGRDKGGEGERDIEGARGREKALSLHTNLATSLTLMLHIQLQLKHIPQSLPTHQLIQ